jgi:peptidoglycan/xylan/chitin deacetylase (PgdA/CDA1 family)
VFTPTRWLGLHNTWDEPSTCDLGIMTPAELQACAGAGVTIESHGHSHLDMSCAPPGEVEEDLRQSQEAIEAATGRRPRFLAYPYGRSSPDARRCAEHAGFTAAFSIDQRGSGSFDRERVQVTPVDGDRLFALKASGHYLSIRHNAVVARAYAAVRSGRHT